MIKTVLCMKWGTKYSSEYVNRLFSMLLQQVTGPFRLVCFTDDPYGLDSRIKAQPIPPLGVAEPIRTRGKWKKVALWASSLGDLQGTALFIDLDSVIVGNIDCYFDIGSKDDVYLERNWSRPLSGLGQTSIFRFPIGGNAHILKKFQENPQSVADYFKYEQHFITHCLGKKINFWPRGWTLHFRIHCLGPFPLRYLRSARLPKTARIVTFPGGPNPSDALCGKWKPESEPYNGRRSHIWKALKALDWASLKRFVMPVPWIAEKWK